MVTLQVSFAPFSSVASGDRESTRDCPLSVSSTGSPVPIPINIHSNLLALRIVVQLIEPLRPTMIGDS